MSPASRGPVVSVQITALEDGHRHTRPEQLVGEEPLEIRVAGPHQQAETVTVTMRTPGHDFELAAGLVVTEGIAPPSDIHVVRYCELPPSQPQLYNVVTVNLRRAVPPGAVRARSQAATASCGICGTATLEALNDRCPPVAPGPVVAADMLVGLPDKLRAQQRVFATTGGLHASGLFDEHGDLVALREDVGRHNALDKLIGWAALAGRLPLADHILVLSGRVSYELVQKAAVAGIPIVAAVSAPTSLAVATASAVGMTLAGFVRDGRANIYSGPERVSPG